MWGPCDLLDRQGGSGIFLIGHFGSGKSHFLAYITQQIRAGKLSARPPEVFPISLLNFPASESLESIVTQEVGLQPQAPDRRMVWSKAAELHSKGIFLAVDELSEFLRSKPNRQSFNEDIRFLQFLGEWAQDHPLWILAALQEQIEHTGDIEYDLYRKIKDRYPIRFLLTPAHVKDLIASKVLQKKPAYAKEVESLVKELKSTFPNASVNLQEFTQLYPLHPVTLELLEEVRDRFSQARGIIDFTLAQLLGNPAKGTKPFLDEPWGRLLSPDLIIDHFTDLFEVQPEFLPIAQKLFPYYRRKVPELFEKKLQQELAWRLLKLLVLVHLSPVRVALDPQQAVQWLLLKVSALQPQKNLEVIERILDTLVREGAYLTKEKSQYRLDLEDNSQQSLEHLLSKTVEDLRGRGESLFESLLPCLDREEFNPFALPRERWQTRKVMWHFHDREIQVWLGGGSAEEPKGLGLQIGLPWGPPPQIQNSFKVIPRPIELTEEILELAALLQLKDRPIGARLLDRVSERIGSRRGWFCSLVYAAYMEASLLLPRGQTVAIPIGRRSLSLQTWLNSLGEWMLRQTYPMFERFAPAHGPLPREAYRQLMQFASEGNLGSVEAPDFVKLIREAYLLPMGLMQRRGPEYLVSSRLEQHELVQLLAPLLDHHPSPRRVYEHLAAPVYGLVPDQIHLLLLMLLIQGEIDILKAGKSFRESYAALPNPLQYDQIVPGTGLNVNELRDLQVLCEGFDIKVPSQWSVSAQKRAIGQLKNAGRRQRDVLNAFHSKLQGLGETSALSGEVENFIQRWLALEKGEHELQGFQQFLFEIGSAAGFVTKARELSALPTQFDSLLRESQRYRHLFGFPCVAHCPNASVTEGLEKLGSPPSFADVDALQAWLSQAQVLYRHYEQWYQGEHQRWWQQVQQHDIWSYRAPQVAGSRHLALDTLCRELEALQSRPESKKCSGVTNLDFQPMCRCGFDGKESPIAEILRRFEAARSQLETELRRFFQQEKVKKKVEEWVDHKLELNPPTLSYLEGKANYPQVDNLALFDQHFSGLELVRKVDSATVVDLLSSRSWEKQQLLRELDRLLDRFGPRFSFQKPFTPPREDLARWCAEQALRQGIPLPQGFTPDEKKLLAKCLQPSWVNEASLKKLEQLGLAEEAVDRVLELLLDGQIPLPARPLTTGPVAAARELLQPVDPQSVEDMAKKMAELYRQHPRMVRIRGKAWLSRLDQLASLQTGEPLAPLTTLLNQASEYQWILVDSLGLPLMDIYRELFQAVWSHWRLERIDYATACAETRTDSFYQDLLKAGLNKPFEKINGLDTLIHSGSSNLADLAKRARAELEIHCQRLLSKLDVQRPLLVFGDHGFRLTPDGKSFTHGGPSTLERIVPVFRFLPHS